MKNKKIIFTRDYNIQWADDEKDCIRNHTFKSGSVYKVITPDEADRRIGSYWHTDFIEDDNLIILCSGSIKSPCWFLSKDDIKNFTEEFK